MYLPRHLLRGETGQLEANFENEGKVLEGNRRALEGLIKFGFKNWQAAAPRNEFPFRTA